MAFIEIKRRCDDCESTRKALAEVHRELDTFRLDYQNLYEKVRINLGKLAKRARDAEKDEPEEEATDPLAQYRSMILARRRRAG